MKLVYTWKTDTIYAGNKRVQTTAPVMFNSIKLNSKNGAIWYEGPGSWNKNLAQRILKFEMTCTENYEVEEICVKMILIL